MLIIIVFVILVLWLCGGGYGLSSGAFGGSPYGGYGFGGIGLILLILLVLALTHRL